MSRIQPEKRPQGRGRSNDGITASARPAGYDYVIQWTVRGYYRGVDDGEPVSGGWLPVVRLADERHVQRTGLDLVHVDPVEDDAAQRWGRGHRAGHQLDEVDPAKRQVPERAVGRPEAVQHQLADVLDGQALQRREQAGRVVEQLHVAYRHARQWLGRRQTGRRQRHEPAAGQRQFPRGRQHRRVLRPDDEQLKNKSLVNIGVFLFQIHFIRERPRPSYVRWLYEILHFMRYNRYDVQL